MTTSTELPIAIAGWLAVLHDVRRRRAHLDEVETKARAEIQVALGEAETGTVDGRPAVRWTRTRTVVIDQKLLKANHPDAYRACQVERTGRRFTVVEDTP